MGEEIAPTASEWMEGFAKSIKDNKDDILTFFRGLVTLLDAAGKSAAWLGGKVGWIPGWASDLSAALGLVNAGILEWSDVASALNLKALAGGPTMVISQLLMSGGGHIKALHDLVAGVDYELAVLKKQARDIKTEIEYLIGQVAQGLEVENLTVLETRLAAINRQINRMQAAKAGLDLARMGKTAKSITELSRVGDPYNKGVGDSDTGSVDIGGGGTVDKRAYPESYSIFENMRSKSTVSLKDYARESTSIYKRISDDIKGFSGDTHKLQLDLLEKQYTQEKKYLGENLVHRQWYERKKRGIQLQYMRDYGTFLERMTVRYEDYTRDVIDKTNIMYDTLSVGLDEMKSQMSDNFYNMMKGNFDDIGIAWDNLWDSMLRKMANTLADMAVEWGANQMLSAGANVVSAATGGKSGGSSWGGDILSGVIGGTVGKALDWGMSLFHSGSSSVPKGGVPRLHAGLGPNEYNAILQGGERVLSISENADMIKALQALVSQVYKTNLLTAEGNKDASRSWAEMTEGIEGIGKKQSVEMQAISRAVIDSAVEWGKNITTAQGIAIGAGALMAGINPIAALPAIVGLMVPAVIKAMATGGIMGGVNQVADFAKASKALSGTNTGAVGNWQNYGVGAVNDRLGYGSRDTGGFDLGMPSGTNTGTPYTTGGPSSDWGMNYYGGGDGLSDGGGFSGDTPGGADDGFGRMYGGITRGPETGYSVKLHGTEAVISQKKGIDAKMEGGEGGGGGLQIVFQGPVYGMDDFNQKVAMAAREANDRGIGTEFQTVSVVRKGLM